MKASPLAAGSFQRVIRRDGHASAVRGVTLDISERESFGPLRQLSRSALLSALIATSQTILN